ncbi:MAG: ammonia-forming cytochrome c nitrite reductase subunit c552, partial [Coxiellaceae bacterium]|nr:ammonia-forming cytochrome c nitrite reductase subunit c552 [Coxiellaceae bacterium]
FTIAWDSQQKKWFHLYSDEHIKSNNPLHWSKHFFTWNVSCAECHSTDVKKNYNASTKTYDTRYHEINVGCQSCHGPGKAHIAWAHKHEPSDHHSRIVKTPMQKIEQCARCHSRRHPVSIDDRFGDAFLDHFMPALLRSDLYYPDGQIKEEVYVYGSFLQSKMYRLGVTCIDCHNPHSLQLVAKGNSLCAQCHNPQGNSRFQSLPKKLYDNPSHHHHQPNSAGAQCVNCHMPTTTYMTIDPRRDHRFGIPRPDLTISIGVPNACNRCHRDQSATWAQQQIEQWFGKRQRGDEFAHVFAKAQANTLPSANPLITIATDSQQASIVRATATQLLLPFEDKMALKAKLHLLTDKNALIRVAAVRSLANVPPASVTSDLLPLLHDPIRAVRIEVASILAGTPKHLIPSAQQDAFEKVMQEYQALQESNRDLASGYFNLGN